MTIADKAKEIDSIKGQIRDAVNQKGGQLSQYAPFSEYPAAILGIPQEIVQGEGWDDNWVVWSPKMKNNTSPAPYVASGDDEIYASGSPWYVFNDQVSNGIDFAKNQNYDLAYVQFDFGEETIVYGVAVLCVDVQYLVDSISVSGSNDGSNWVPIQNVVSRSQYATYFEGVFLDAVSYRYYKFSNITYRNTYATISEIYFIRDKQSVGEES